MTELTNNHRLLKILVVLSAISTIILVGWALKYTRVVAMPLVFAFFVALLMRPIQVWLEKKLPDRLWWVALAATMMVILLSLGVVLGVAGYAVQRISSEEIQAYGEQLRAHWHSLQSWLEERGMAVGGEGGSNGMVMERAGTAAEWAVRSLTDLASMLVLIFFLVLLMLLEAARWQRKTRIAVNHHYGPVADTVEATAMQVRRYLLVQSFIAFISAVLAGLWLWIIGVPFPLIWALLTFLFDFIPSVGSIASGLMATLVALAALGWGPALLTAVGLVTMEQVVGNLLDPVLKARKLEISPIVVLISVLFWAWTWGVAGAVLAVPITATLIIICAHVPRLRPIALLLSNTADEEKLMDQVSAHNGTSPRSESGASAS